MSLMSKQDRGLALLRNTSLVKENAWQADYDIPIDNSNLHRVADLSKLTDRKPFFEGKDHGLTIVDAAKVQTGKDLTQKRNSCLATFNTQIGRNTAVVGMEGGQIVPTLKELAIQKRKYS